jgi:2-polyprenyl-6-methoxyphenol hydroxylase-like FAD-dependent oxidoreductase
MRAFLLTMSLLAMSAPAALAQQSEKAPEPQAAPRTPRPAQAPQPGATPAVQPPTLVQMGQPINVKVEVTITDQRGSMPVVKKTATVVTADGMNGFIRSMANFSSLGNVPLNIDVAPQILADGKIRLRVNLEYDLPATMGQAESNAERIPRVTQIRENLAVIVENSREIIAAQSADPISDRQVTIGIKATTLR